VKPPLSIQYVRVPSASPERSGTTYIVTVVNQKAVACTCIGFTHRLTCSHMTFWDDALREALLFEARRKRDDGKRL
jgi:hypothetical protein